MPCQVLIPVHRLGYHLKTRMPPCLEIRISGGSNSLDSNPTVHAAEGNLRQYHRDLIDYVVDVSGTNQIKFVDLFNEVRQTDEWLCAASNPISVEGYSPTCESTTTMQNRFPADTWTSKTGQTISELAPTTRRYWDMVAGTNNATEMAAAWRDAANYFRSRANGAVIV